MYIQEEKGKSIVGKGGKMHSVGVWRLYGRSWAGMKGDLCPSFPQLFTLKKSTIFLNSSLIMKL